MQASAQTPSSRLIAIWCSVAGCVLLADVLTGIVPGGWFASSSDGLITVLTSVAVACAIAGAVVLVTALIDSLTGRRPGLRQLLWTALLAPPAVLCAHTLLSGARISASEWIDWLRPAAWVLSALGVALVVRVLCRSNARGLICLLASVVLVGSALVDRFVLPGLYPVFHLALVVIFVGAAAVFGACVRPPARSHKALVACGLFSCAAVIALMAGLLPGAAQKPRQRTLGSGMVANRLVAPLVPRAELDVEQWVRERAAAIVNNRGQLPPRWLDERVPNHRSLDVVLITIDTLRADALGCYGNEEANTPTLDALARESVRFEHAYAQYPASPHSMASFLCGLYPRSVRHEPFGAGSQHPRTLAERFQTAGFATAGVFALEERRMRQHFTYVPRGFDSIAAGGAGPSTAPQIEKQALDALRKTAGRRRFLWLHWFDPHWPYSAPNAIPSTDARKLYADEVSYADASVGAFLAALKKAGAWDRTIVVVHSDHGEAFGEHGLVQHGSGLHEEQVRVPLLIRIPGVEPRVINSPVGLVDLAPTLLSLTGLPPGPELHGTDLTAAMTVERPVPHLGPDVAYAQLMSESFTLREEMLRYGSLKVRHDRIAGTWIVHDMKTDPDEQNPLTPEDVADGPLLVALTDLMRLRAEGSEGASQATPWKDLDQAALVQVIEQHIAEGGVDPVRARLLELLAPDQPRDRRLYALEVLAKSPAPDDEARFIELLSDEDAFIRGAAAMALASFDGKTANAALRRGATEEPALLAPGYRCALSLRDALPPGESLEKDLETAEGWPRVLLMVAAAHAGLSPYDGLLPAFALGLDLNRRVRFLATLSGSNPPRFASAPRSVDGSTVSVRPARSASGCPGAVARSSASSRTRPKPKKRRPR